jgi:hypothetical protein
LRIGIALWNAVNTRRQIRRRWRTLLVPCATSLQQIRPVQFHPVRAWCEVHALRRHRALHRAHGSPRNSAPIFTHLLLNS